MYGVWICLTKGTTNKTWSAASVQPKPKKFMNIELINQSYLMVIIGLYFDSDNDSKLWKGFSNLGSISLDSKAPLYAIQIIFPVIKATKTIICPEWNLLVFGVKLALPRFALRDSAKMSMKLWQLKFWWFKNLEVRSILIVSIKDDEISIVHVHLSNGL